MGLLIKFILFGIVIYYLLKTVGGFVYRLLGGQPPQQQYRQQSQSQKKGDVNIDYMPKGRKKRSPDNSKDGDYIDFEEIK